MTLEGTNVEQAVEALLGKTITGAEWSETTPPTDIDLLWGDERVRLDDAAPAEALWPVGATVGAVVLVFPSEYATPWRITITEDWETGRQVWRLEGPTREARDS